MITSVDNKRIKEVSKLSNRKYRKEMGLFLVEGSHLVEEACKHNLLVEVYSLDENDYPNNNVVSENVMRKISSLDTVPNIIGVCKFKEEKELGNKLLILDDIQDPGNLGTIIRSAVAFNIDTIVLSLDTVDLYNDKVIRSSEGMIFNINIIKKDLNGFINELKSNNYEIIGTNVSKGKDINDINLKNKFAILMGNEGTGLKVELQELCDDFLYIKMNELCESINVGVATSIILYEIAKRG